ncbi:MAG TPA: ABC transporter permease [Terriglobales bacterium]|nr:ABC transporter permease [Terriglobales bacterium]
MRWYQRFFRRGLTEKKLDAELRFHLEQQIADYIATGMKPEEAGRRVRLEFGGLDHMKEECRDVGSARFVETLFQDMRYGFRQLGRSPGFTVVAILTLALGIGANTVIFSAVNGVLLRPLPYPNSNRLAQVWSTNPHTNRWGDWVSYPDFFDWRAQNKVFEDLVAYRTWLTNITGGDHPDALFVVLASSSLFSVLQSQPLLGRSFLPDEDKPGHNRVVVLSDAIWRSRFGSDPHLVGTAVAIDGESYTVIGIMPPRFRFPLDLPEGFVPSAWLPLGLDPSQSDRGSHNYRVVGRLRPGFTLSQAQADMEAIARNLAQAYAADQSLGIKLAGLEENVTSEVRPALLVLLGAVGLVLLIACANVGNLLLSRAVARQREVALRLAIGANRSRIVKQMLTESVLLALIGGGVGLLLAFQGLSFLIKLAPSVPRLHESTVDGRVLIFCSLLSAATGILFGLVPTFQASRIHLGEALKQSGPSRRLGSGPRLRRMVAVAETALALMLLIGAGLLIRSFVRLSNVELGFNPQNVLTAMIMLPESRYSAPNRQAAFFKEAIRRIEALPGVESVAAADSVPLVTNDTGSVSVEGHPEPTFGGVWIQAERPKITPGYFRVMGIPLLRGRTFTWADNETSLRVAIVSEAAARLYWPNEDPIGKRVSVDEGDESEGRIVWRQVIGVVGDVRQDGLADKVRPSVYTPLSQLPVPFAALIVKSRMDPRSLADPVRRQVMVVDKDQPLFSIQTMQEVVADSVSNRAFQTVLLSLFAAVAMTLATIGIYGVMSHSTAQRTREIGVRMALGAQKHDTLRLVVGQGMFLALLGVSIGVIGALVLTRFMSSLLYGVKPTDPMTFIGVSLVLAAVSLVASYVPARRATKVDPMVALRHE